MSKDSLYFVRIKPEALHVQVFLAESAGFSYE